MAVRSMLTIFPTSNKHQPKSAGAAATGIVRVCVCEATINVLNVVPLRGLHSVTEETVKILDSSQCF